MRILMISYREENYDGRLRELKKSLQEIGDLTVFSIPNCSKKTQAKSGIVQYFNYIKDAVRFSRRFGKTDILFVDDRKAIIPSAITKRIIRPSIIILDCRELYFFTEVHTLSGKVGCILERFFIPKADLIIAANKERAEIMNKEYSLERNVLVFENIRKLEYSEDCDIEIIKEQYKQYYNPDLVTVISTAGCNINQDTDVLVKNFIRVKHKAQLLLVGNCEHKDKEIIQKIIRDNDLKNVHILGRVGQNELKYLLSISNIGIVAYSEEGRNNKFCASGKVYEYINEGLPIVTTTNPPLKNLCESEHIGVTDADFSDGINTVIENYEYYSNNAIRYATINTVESNNEQLIKSLQKILKKV